MVPDQFRLNQIRTGIIYIIAKIQFTTEDFMKHSEVIKKIKNTLLLYNYPYN